jgi:hypothetical protein
MKKLLIALLTVFIITACSDESTNPPDEQGTMIMSANRATLLVNTERQFYAVTENMTNKNVVWTVEPSDGGTATPVSEAPNYVIYKAPANIGTYKLIATSVADANVKGEVVITVVNELPEADFLFEITNIAAVQSKPTKPSVFTTDQEYTITKITTYHYYNNNTLPGTISLKDENGAVYGPWQAVGRVGQGNVANAYWECYPYVRLKAGTYTIVDSDPDTWSQNAGTEGRGMCWVEGVK